ncbi:LegC family aminotransferase [Paenibacillus cisolokensis]|uniref:LegC family aminotransferase n=1 Tax=Paenibacillus cisolokensis TaxID=1658519 RepID=UPI003D2DA54E
MDVDTFPQRFVELLKRALPDRDTFTALHQPSFGGREWEYVKDCLDTGWVSSVGQYVDRFERNLAEFTGSPYAVAVVNGTAALHICFVLAGVKAGDEVIVPSLSFVATANAVAYCGAIPHFADVAKGTLGLDPDKLKLHLQHIAELRSDGHTYNRESGRRIAAIVPMHTFGHPVDLDPLIELCAQYRIPLVEDAAESLGSYYKGKHTGTFGKLAALSFNGNKIITTGGGGAILTGDPELAKAAKHLTTTAKLPHRWAFWHDRVGYNYRMPNLNAALGCAQLEQLPQLLNRKRKLAERYKETFAAFEGVDWFEEPQNAKSNYWLQAVLLDPALIHARDDILDLTNREGLMTRPVWTPLHRLPMYGDCPRMNLDTSEELERRIINIPSGPDLIRE